MRTLSDPTKNKSQTQNYYRIEKEQREVPRKRRNADILPKKTAIASAIISLSD
jgi:hypothetical protein